VSWVRHDLPSQLGGHGVGFGDLNGDGRNDLVGPRGWLQAPLDRRTGRWLWHPDFVLNRDASIPILVFDVDGDDDNDLIWGRGHDIGLYWMEQKRVDEGNSEGDAVWQRHAIDTSWSQPHSILLADIDRDGRPELIAGKRYLGHDGKDPGEYDPLVAYWYRFDPLTLSWRRGVIAKEGDAGFGLDPKAVDLDNDGDVDIVGAGRSGLYLFENLLVRTATPPSQVTTFVPDYPDHADLLVLSTGENVLAPVKTPFDWARRRSHILLAMQKVMGDLPDSSRRVPLEVEELQSDDSEHYVRHRISFVSEPGDRVPAYLLVPKSLSEPAPAMLCLHQTTTIGKAEPVGLGGKPSLQYAHELANRGYVCLAPDYPSFGDYDYDFRADGSHYVSGSMKAIWNNLRAVDLLQSQSDVDADRIGCIGHSLGGHNGLFTAVFDQRLRAVVTSCGFTAFHRYYEGDLSGWTSDRYMPRIREVYKNDPDRMPFDFHEVIAALSPRPVFISAPTEDSNFEVTGVQEAVNAARQVFDLHGASDKLCAAYPECQHRFPDEIRANVFQWLDENL